MLYMSYMVKLPLSMNKSKYLLILLLLMIWGGAHAYSNVGHWLAISDEPVEAELIVALNGYDRIAKAAQMYHQGLADSVLLTVHSNPEVLTKRGVDPENVHTAPGVRSTFEEALATRSHIKNNPISSLMVVSDPWHLARVRWSFERVLENIEVTIYFVASDQEWPADEWAEDARTRYIVASEVSKFIFYRINYGLLEQEEVPEWVKEWGEAYFGFLRKMLKS